MRQKEEEEKKKECEMKKREKKNSLRERKKKMKKRKFNVEALYDEKKILTEYEEIDGKIMSKSAVITKIPYKSTLAGLQNISSKERNKKRLSMQLLKLQR